MKPSNRELWLSLLAILVITLAYLFVMNALQGIPAGGSLFGHSIGIMGFVLMLMTEILYTLRKRSRSARWGRMSSWLQFHIFTGLVGPYMVLLHTSWKLNGLAGFLTLLTIVIVISGFIGRYIYTSVPRTVDGAEIEADELQRQIQDAEANLRTWIESQPEIADRLAGLLAVPAGNTAIGPGLLFERSFLDWKYRWQWRKAKQELPETTRFQVSRLEQLQIQKRGLNRQLDSLMMARRLLALWHTIHIPIGIAVFTTAFIHVAAVLFFIVQLR
jgi:hypothetical protein